VGIDPRMILSAVGAALTPPRITIMGEPPQMPTVP
jgi:hypothetical protein